MRKETIALLSLFLVAFIWASAFIAIDMALESGWGTFSILTVRGLVGGLILLPFAIKTKFWKNKKSLIYGVVMGIFFFIAFYFQTEGQARTTIGNCAFLTGLYVVFAPLVLRIFFKEKQMKKVYIGCLVAIIGVFFLTVLGEGDGLSFNIGDVLVIIGSFFFALQIIAAEKSAEHASSATSTSLMLLTMGILSLIFMSISLIGGDNVLGVESGIIFDVSILPVLYCAVFSSAIASFVQIAAQKHVSSSKASIVMAQEALLATIMAAIYNSELPNVFVYIGGGLMFISIMIIEVNFKKKLENNNEEVST